MREKIVDIIDEYSRLGIDQQIDYAKFYLYSIITNSTALEGSTMTEEENRLLFDEGIGAQITEHRKSKKKNDPIKSSQKTSQKSSQKTQQKSSQKTQQKTFQKIIELIREDAVITTQKMADNIGISRRAVAKAIAKLQAEGIIRRVGPDKGGHWEVIPQK
ncbi:MAG: winged helix-turn-helix transcriptional regulator [Bacteroidales bacterium]|nr:winged helix-turn-helix transcriptional regulator [Bacteroidales bacterium]